MTVTLSSRIRRGLALVTTGVVCLTAAGVLAWTVAPDMRGLPVDGDVSRHLAGTAKLLLNPVALSSGDVKAAVLRDTPVTSERVLSVLSIRDGVAQVADARSLVVNGAIVGATEATYGVDRTTLEAAADTPADWQVVPHEGLSISWPVDAQPRDYVGWINPTQTTTPITYLREESVAGQRAHVYQISSEPQALVDELVRARLPWAMSAATMAGLAAETALSADERAQLDDAMPRDDGMYDVDYTYQFAATYWVEPETGTVLKTEQREIQRVGPLVGDEPLALVPISDVSLTSTEDSVRHAAERADAVQRRITLYGVALPAILAVVGGAGVVAGGLLVARRPRQETVLGSAAPSAS